MHDVEVADRCTGREISNDSEALIPSANSIAINLPYEEVSQLRTDAFEYAFLPALSRLSCPLPFLPIYSYEYLSNTHLLILAARGG